jgi:hypothetical protein
MLWASPTSAQQTICDGYGYPPTVARTLKIDRAGQQVGTLRTLRRRRKTFDVNHAFIEGRRLSHHAGITCQPVLW